MDDLIYYVLLYYVVVKAVLATTHTPDPTTVYGRLYKALEWSVLVIGRVKEGAASDLPVRR